MSRVPTSVLLRTVIRIPQMEEGIGGKQGEVLVILDRLHQGGEGDILAIHDRLHHHFDEDLHLQRKDLFRLLPNEIHRLVE